MAIGKPRVRLEWSVIVQISALVIFLAVPFYLLLTSALNVGDPQQIPGREFGLANFAALASCREWIANTIIVAVCGTLMATVIGVALAWILFRTMLPGRGIFDLLLAIPYPLGPLVGALAWHELGSAKGGLINEAFAAVTGLTGPVIDTSSITGIVVVMAIFEAPVAVLIIGAAMQRMDPSLEECSSVFGGGHFRTALRVTLPLMMPAILSSALFLFVSMLGAFAIPAVLGAGARITVVTTGIYSLFQGYPPNYPLAAALGIVMIGLTFVAVWFNGLLLSHRSYVVVSGKAYRPRLIDTGGWTPVLTALVAFYVGVSLILPMGTLLLFSLQPTSSLSWDVTSWTLQNYRYVVFEFPTTRSAIFNSVMLGVATGAVGVAASLVLVWTVQRSRSRGRWLLEQLTMLPQAFPHIIFAFGFLWALLILPYPNLYGSLTALLLAYVILFIPLGYRSLTGVMTQLDVSLEEAARVGGAGWTATMRTITLPLLRSGMVATWALLFMVSVREVSASIFLTSPDSPVLGPSILSFWDSGGLPRVSALAMVQAVIVLIALLIIRAGSRESSRPLRTPASSSTAGAGSSL
jgi:iron(III) transport system permease protein